MEYCQRTQPSKLDRTMLNDSIGSTEQVTLDLKLWKGYADRLFFVQKQMGVKSLSMAVVKLIDGFLAHHPGYNDFEQEVVDQFGRSYKQNTYFKKVVYPQRLAEQARLLSDSSEIPKSAVPGP